MWQQKDMRTLSARRGTHTATPCKKGSVRTLVMNTKAFWSCEYFWFGERLVRSLANFTLMFQQAAMSRQGFNFWGVRHVTCGLYPPQLNPTELK